MMRQAHAVRRARRLHQCVPAAQRQRGGAGRCRHGSKAPVPGDDGGHVAAASVPGAAQPPWAAIQPSTFCSSTSSGTEPSFSTSAWNWRMSNLPPSFCSARRRSSWIFSSPVL